MSPASRRPNSSRNNKSSSFKRTDRDDKRTSSSRDNRGSSSQREDRRPSSSRDTNGSSFPRNDRDDRRPSTSRDTRGSSFPRNDRDDRRPSTSRDTRGSSFPRNDRDDKRPSTSRDTRGSSFPRNDRDDKRPSTSRDTRGSSFPRNDRDDRRPSTSRDTRGSFQRDDRRPSFRNKISKRTVEETKPGMRINQFIAHSGISSRREADKLIVAGLVSVNGKVITEMGFRVLPTDVVKFNNESISSEKLQYLLLNKPKGYLVSDDPGKKKTVEELIGKACKERVYPVGRLDRQSSGLLLYTNDGAMSKKLTNPKQRFKKIYHISLDKNLKHGDMKKMVDTAGAVHFLDIQTMAYVQNASKKEVGIEINGGKNKSIVDMFEKMDYKVTKLDRVYYGGLTKKDITRGRFRFLTEQEIALLKMI
jgi:23S rRNA pseudouridine2605 synthase